MYTEYFGLVERPFSLTPDTSFFFDHAGHREAMNVLRVALHSGEGLIKITGEVGTGKTMLCRKLLNTLNENFYTAYLPNPALEPHPLKLAIAAELEIKLARRLPQHELTKLINGRLFELHQAGKQVVICVDEAQALPDASLEALRLLTNLETEKHKLLQLVLFGQPELDVKINRPALRQVKQRVAYAFDLKPLNRRSLKEYIAHRLAVAGLRGQPLFLPRAVEMLYRASSGIPRVVNILCTKSLMLAYGKGDTHIGSKHVRLAAGDTEGARRINGFSAALTKDTWVNVATGALALALAGGVFLLWSGNR